MPTKNLGPIFPILLEYPMERPRQTGGKGQRAEWAQRKRHRPTHTNRMLSACGCGDTPILLPPVLSDPPLVEPF